ncbi:MAG TPA: GNAT family N-acetyltransferase [Frankiaceae bacterium]|nr:GNAT family N-acetyltransferase [Frankiaceae bacterium]
MTEGTPTDPLDAHLVAASEDLARHSPRTALLARGDGVAVAAAGVSGQPFNVGWVVGQPHDPHAAVGWLRDVLAGTGRPYSVQVPEPFLPAVAEALAAHGLTASGPMPGMVRPATEDVPQLPPGLRIVRVADEAELVAHAVAVGTGFGAPDPRAMTDVLVPSLLADPSVAMFSGYVDGAPEPVATSVCAVAEGMAGIYAVTAHEPVRRRGIGAALTWAAVAAGARLGAPLAALQASELGEPVYRRMGFETVRTYHRFVAG